VALSTSCCSSWGALNRTWFTKARDPRAQVREVQKRSLSSLQGYCKPFRSREVPNKSAKTFSEYKVLMYILSSSARLPACVRELAAVEHYEGLAELAA
jgi:hypothetical protein